MSWEDLHQVWVQMSTAHAMKSQRKSVAVVVKICGQDVFLIKRFHPPYSLDVLVDSSSPVAQLRVLQGEPHSASNVGFQGGFLFSCMMDSKLRHACPG